MSFTGKTKASSYKDILQMNNSNNGVDTTTRNVVDGEGTASALSLSDDQIVVQPKDSDGTAILKVTNKSGSAILSVDSTNTLVKAGATQTSVNTQIQSFSLSSSSALPASTNWTGIPTSGQTTQTRMEMGSGSTPNTSLTVTLSGDDVVGHIFYVPINITIDSCNVWAGADASSGDVIQFSVMSYDIDTNNSSTGGDLSNGVENCVSPSTITSAGYEQAYYQALTVSTADVDAGKVIIAFIKSDGTNSDYSVNMNLVYHIR